MRACGLIECIDWCQLTECDKVILNDHQGNAIDLAIESFCDCNQNEHDKLKHTVLDNSKQSDIRMFNEKLDQAMLSYKLRQRVMGLESVENAQSFNEIDNSITDALNKARVEVEGPTRRLSYSIKKAYGYQ